MITSVFVKEDFKQYTAVIPRKVYLGHTGCVIKKWNTVKKINNFRTVQPIGIKFNPHIDHAIVH